MFFQGFYHLENPENFENVWKIVKCPGEFSVILEIRDD